MEIHQITRGHKHFPRWPALYQDGALHLVHHLWVSGETSRLTDRRAVVITGARAATAYGLHMAAAIAGELAQAGVTIWTTHGFGIDSAAIRGALTAGGRVVVVTATPIDRPHPLATAPLLSQVTEAGGVIISEHPSGAELDPDRCTPTRSAMRRRRDVLAEAAAGTVIVEAGLKSGALDQAERSHERARAVHALPGPVTSAASAGCHELIKRRRAKLLTSAADVLALLDE